MLVSVSELAIISADFLLSQAPPPPPPPNCRVGGLMAANLATQGLTSFCSLAEFCWVLGGRSIEELKKVSTSQHYINYTITHRMQGSQSKLSMAITYYLLSLRSLGVLVHHKQNQQNSNNIKGRLKGQFRRFVRCDFLAQ